MYLREKTSLLGLTCTSRNKVMLMMTPPLLRYFWFHSIYSLATSCSLQSAVCSLQSANVIHRCSHHYATLAPPPHFFSFPCSFHLVERFAFTVNVLNKSRAIIEMCRAFPRSRNPLQTPQSRNPNSLQLVIT